MQQDCFADESNTKSLRRRPTKVLKIAESFTNLDETAKAGRFVRGPNWRAGRRRDGLEGRTKKCCDDDYCAKESIVSDDSEKVGDRRVTGSSCTALRTAVAALYPFDDFNLEKIGSGFFSEVFKVSKITVPKKFFLYIFVFISSSLNYLAYKFLNIAWFLCKSNVNQELFKLSSNKQLLWQKYTDTMGWAEHN